MANPMVAPPNTAVVSLSSGYLRKHQPVLIIKGRAAKGCPLASKKLTAMEMLRRLNTDILPYNKLELVHVNERLQRWKITKQASFAAAFKHLFAIPEMRTFVFTRPQCSAEQFALAVTEGCGVAKTIYKKAFDTHLWKYDLPKASCKLIIVIKVTKCVAISVIHLVLLEL
ncbi:hypothetical protein M514_04797 [Trichuris suis]|uniref:Uncharacterized protein n=1 Tax=Trichuris suis TaxID=68888 RepID=A0A085NUP6_9BILA|nr:hypothetical protein M514_04797 [Trichuris suis]